MENHYFDGNGVYTGSAPAHDDSLPPANAVRNAPPSRPGFWPVLDAGSGEWTLLEDHRGREGWVGGVHTVVAALGPLPEGWSDAAPPREYVRTPAEKRRDEYARLLDPVRDEAIAYWLEAEARRVGGDETGCESATAIFRERLERYLRQKEAIRAALPDATPEPETAGQPGRYYLTASGTYHVDGCRYTQSAGEWTDPDGIRRRRPHAKPCGLCRPPVL